MNIQKLFSISVVAALVGISSASFAHAADVDKVVLKDGADGKMSVTSTKMDLKAGAVTFDVTNAGTMQHEMLVIQLTPEQIAKPDSLPYNEADLKVYEDKVKDFGEVSELDPGATGSLTLNLTPGTYMLLCNIEGHYKAKMYTIVHVS